MNAQARKKLQEIAEHALGLSSALVALRTFPIDVIDADPDEERARDILQGAGLGRFAA